MNEDELCTWQVYDIPGPGLLKPMINQLILDCYYSICDVLCGLGNLAQMQLSWMAVVVVIYSRGWCFRAIRGVRWEHFTTARHGQAERACTLGRVTNLESLLKLPDGELKERIVTSAYNVKNEFGGSVT